MPRAQPTNCNILPHFDWRRRRQGKINLTWNYHNLYGSLPRGAPLVKVLHFQNRFQNCSKIKIKDANVCGKQERRWPPGTWSLMEYCHTIKASSSQRCWGFHLESFFNFFFLTYFIFTPEVLYIVFVSEMYLLSRGIRHLLKKVLSVFLDRYSGAHSTLCPTWASQQMFLVQRVTLGCTTLQKCPSSSSCFFQGA